MYQVTKDTIVYDVMLNVPETQPLFERIGMHCLGCAYATGESIEAACEVHENVDQFASGVERFVVGLGKKVLIANNIGLLWDAYANTAASNLTFVGACRPSKVL